MLKRTQVLQMLDSLPEQFPADELIDRIILLNKISQGEQELREGKGLTTEEVRYRLRKWIS